MRRRTASSIRVSSIGSTRTAGPWPVRTDPPLPVPWPDEALPANPRGAHRPPGEDHPRLPQAPQRHRPADDERAPLRARGRARGRRRCASSSSPARATRSRAGGDFAQMPLGGESTRRRPWRALSHKGDYADLLLDAAALRQAGHRARQRARAGRRARARGRVHLLGGAHERAARHAGDQRRPLPDDGHGAARARRPAPAAPRDDAPRREDGRRRGGAHRPRRAGRRARRARRDGPRDRDAARPEERPSPCASASAPSPRRTTSSSRRALPMLRERLAACLATDDAREGLMAFLEKRDPVWTGR